MFFLRRTLVRSYRYTALCKRLHIFYHIFFKELSTEQQIYKTTAYEFHKSLFRSFIRMNQFEIPTEFYNKRITELQESLEQLYKKRSLLGWLRFAILAFTALVVYNIWGIDTAMIVAVIIAGAALFLFIVSKDTNNKEIIDNLETLVAINKQEIEYSKGNYYDRYDGNNLEPGNHAYANDLDLFGKASLYQYINRCHAAKAKALLAERLLQPLNKAQILLQQEAAKELATKSEWRQQLHAFGYKQEIGLQTEKKVIDWLNAAEKHFTQSFWKSLLYIYPVITVGSFYLYLSDIISTPIFSLLVFMFYIFSLLVSKNITTVYNLLSKIVPEISVLYKQLNWFEKETFQSNLLLEIQKQIKHNNLKASQEILHLKNILNRFDVRLNIFAFIILNTFLLWDLHQMMALKKWKLQNKTIVPHWFEAIADIEVVSTIATLAFNHPQWIYPEISEAHFTLSGEEIGHPLIPEQQRVNNSFSIAGIAKIDLITGSNMAGKSTFLRSLGINMILAYTGAPVSAKSFTVSISKLMSSMRITDNLAENTSTFYAELKKLKAIIEEVNKHENLFILLDEILRGTNSLDRHTGSAALIKQLIKENAVALIATHDVELAKLENDYPANISNYHFDVQVAGEELYFDYKLKEGICTSLNASLLMKKIGIELG
ncbi:MutS family DNA mismatch repair protein [soil metagenome]